MSLADRWGTTPDEELERYPCDAFAAPGSSELFRSVHVRADPKTLFRWLCQLRKAPYSYDWLDNFGRTSPRTLTPGLEQLAVGQRVMTIFRIVSFEPDVHLTIELLPRLSRLAPLVVSYVVAPAPGGSRLTVKAVAPRAKSRVGRALFRGLAWGDLFMMRKQLLTLKELAERRE